MSLNETPSAERLHIGFFGCRNAGKSSLVNAVTGQMMSIVSGIKGTTTDPVTKSMELLPLGPVVIIDTPGFDDDDQSLGELRVERTFDALNRSDIAVLVLDAQAGLRKEDMQLLQMIRERNLPRIIVWNKADLVKEENTGVPEKEKVLSVSAETGKNIELLKELLGQMVPEKEERHLVSDLVSPGDFVVLVCPIDESAPKGRLILPQQQTIRDLLDAGALPVVTRETELAITLDQLGKKPAMVITDSQAFRIVNSIVPDEIPLTSFSILMARYKGFLHTAVSGIRMIEELKEGDRILLAEGCTHHRQCNDIGTVKIPRWLKNYTGADLVIDTCTGRDYPKDLTPYRMVIHCGGCMLTEQTLQVRMKQALSQGVPFTNYGIVIARMTGILERSLRIFPDLYGHSGFPERKQQEKRL